MSNKQSVKAGTKTSGSYSGMAKRHDLADQNIIDYRSDTVTQPTAAMRQVMAQAAVGDDVYGEDPSVNLLEEKVAQLMGKEAALFFPTGTMSNLAALLSHCQRGEEVIVGDQYHIYRDEACGASVLGGIAMQPVTTDQRGAFSVEQLAAVIKPDDAHCAISRLLCLENTVSGTVQDQDNIKALAALAKSHGLLVHMDGARLLHAAVAQGATPAALVDDCDSVSLCLSKGMGLPLGSVLSGDHAFIQRGRRNRKLLGGGMRQAGVIAAAGLYALEHHIERLADDHRRAQRLAQGLADIQGLEIDPLSVDTNVLFITPSEEDQAALNLFLADNGVLIGGQAPSSRMVVHLDIDDAAIDKTLALFQQYYQH
ncbi:MAG: low-specificity L-threonine aldolase [Oceanospirillaceae bacterium]